MGISKKKTIYTVFESKQDVLMAIADRYARDFTDMRQEIEADTELDTLEKLERLFCAIPTKYYNIGLSRIFELAQKYPKQYKYLMEAVSQGWALAEQYLEKGIREGKIRKNISKPVVMAMIRATLDGIIAKDNPEIYDYDIPQALRELYATKDYGRWATTIDGRRTVPVCFLATNHTTGGNSGSPIINGRGELVGLNFDRTWRSTMSDVAFDETICRNIAVDVRYVLFVIDRIGGAGYLFGEMDFSRRK